MPRHDKLEAPESVSEVALKLYCGWRYKPCCIAFRNLVHDRITQLVTHGVCRSFLAISVDCFHHSI